MSGIASVVSADEAEVMSLLNQPEQKIDIGRAALIIAKDIDPEVDVKRYMKQISTLAARARRLTGSSTDPDHRIRALNTLLYQTEKIQPDTSDPNATKPVPC